MTSNAGSCDWCKRFIISCIVFPPFAVHTYHTLAAMLVRTHEQCNFARLSRVSGIERAVIRSSASDAIQPDNDSSDDFDYAWTTRNRLRAISRKEAGVEEPFPGFRFAGIADAERPGYAVEENARHLHRLAFV